MTNPTEGRLLRSSPYQWRVARGLVAGVAAFYPGRPNSMMWRRGRRVVGSPSASPRIVVQPCPAQHRELVEVLVADRA